NLNSIVGIAASRAGGVEVLDALYQAIANNTVLVIATATPRNYKHFIENKTALDDVIEKIDIKQPTGNKAIQILESKVGVFEYQNQVFFSYAAVTAAVELSNKYLPDRFLPEKGIEILRETAIKIGRQKGKNAFITKDDVAFIISEKTGIPLNA
ncbi:hypothetical protein HYZ76_02050, partial [Candidatus Falkowbacteria bacterium]|nr:hypothetical protein [Candidatus Falkowbacteria bacterium]